MRGVRISKADADAVRSAMETLRADNWLRGTKEEDVRLEMHIALWRHPGEANDDVKRATALLAGQCYVRDQRHVAPTAPLPLEHEDPPKHHESWWGMLINHNED